MREAGASLRKSKGITQKPLRAQPGCALLEPERNALVRNGGRGVVLFVGAGAVKPRDGDIQQAEVDAELGAVVNQMVHHHAANTGYAWHGEDLLTTGEQLPTLEHFLIAHGSERGARLRGFLVEHGKNILA